MSLKDLIDSLRADWWSAMFLGIVVFMPLSVLTLVPLFIGPALLLTLAPFISARFAFKDIEYNRGALGAVLGAMEATVLLVVIATAVTMLIGPLFISILEGAMVAAVYGLSIVFGFLGARSLDH